MKWERRFWSKVALPDENGCMLWLKYKAKDGYAKFSLGGKDVPAHRVSLIWSDGEPSSPELEAAHSCRNRHCVAPRHLRWATRTENMFDKLRDGTVSLKEKNGRAKLNLDKVREIRNMYHQGNGNTQERLGKQFGVDRSTISQIVNNKIWMDEI